MIVCDERMYQNIKPGGTAGENTLVPADWDRSFFYAHGCPKERFYRHYRIKIEGRKIRRNEVKYERRKEDSLQNLFRRA